ncbi:hypothetical protein LWI29_000717 [Acer saccharum]|uniref:Uncharacterized protein n=1 Tax=Acer saccharum TaxID=4024 RepID=A0AA39VVW2_ACESA|nr:hypothetical protein LWI29_000717 [Acer saccharum]
MTLLAEYSEQTQVLLTSVAYVHLKHAEVSKYTRNLLPAGRAILLSGPADCVAHYFEAKLLLLDAIDFSLKIQSKYGTSNKESSFKRSSLESTLEDFLAFWVHFQSILKRKNSKVFELQAHCGSKGAVWIYHHGEWKVLVILVRYVEMLRSHLTWITSFCSPTLQIIQDLLKHSKIYLLVCIGRDTLLVTLTNIFGTDTLDEHQQLIVDSGALLHLVNLLKRHKDGNGARAVYSVIRRAADAIANLTHENSSIKTCVRMEGGIPPLVELLEFTDTKVQRVFAGARGPWHLKTRKIRIRLLNATLFQPHSDAMI